MIELNEDEFEEFIDLLKTCVFSEFPYINSNIAEIILKKIIEAMEDDDL